jgi:hypothetical protein
MPSPSISTVFPAANPRMTICATWRHVSQQSDISLPPVLLKRYLTVRTGAEVAHPGKVRRFPGAEPLENIVYHAVQTVRGLAWRHSGPAGQLPGDVVLLHTDFNLSAGHLETDRPGMGRNRQTAHNQLFAKAKYF